VIFFISDTRGYELISYCVRFRVCFALIKIPLFCCAEQYGKFSVFFTILYLLSY